MRHDEQVDMSLAYMLEPEGTGFNIPLAISLKGPIELNLLEQSIRKVISKCEILRSNYLMHGMEVVQKIKEESDFIMEYEDMDTDDLNDVINKFIRSFVLEEDSLIRAKIIRIAEDDHVLIFDVHHIIMDGLSLEQMVKKILLEYQKVEVPYERLQFKDYAVYQRENIEQNNKNKEYWRNQIDSSVQVLQLGESDQRGRVVSQSGSNLKYNLDNELSDKIHQFLKDHDCTKFQFMMAAYYLTLAELSGQTDIVVGAVTTGRDRIELKDMIGLFIKTLPIRIQADKDMDLEQILVLTKKVILEAIDHQNISFQELVKQSGVATLPGHRPIFDVAMVVQNDQPLDTKIGDVFISGIDIKLENTKYDLFLEVRNVPEGMQLKFEYCVDIFSETFIEEFAQRFIENINCFLSEDQVLLEDKVKAHISTEDTDNFDEMELSMDFTF